LRVVVSQADVQVFVNERARGQGRAFLDLVPGTYRVLLVRQGVTRRRTVVVVAGHDTDVPVDWDADAAFSATPTWIGFVWPQGSDKSEPAMSRYARASTQHDVLTIGIASAALAGSSLARSSRRRPAFCCDTRWSSSVSSSKAVTTAFALARSLDTW
jgi:hypothetical protein